MDEKKSLPTPEEEISELKRNIGSLEEQVISWS